MLCVDVGVWRCGIDGCGVSGFWCVEMLLGGDAGVGEDAGVRGDAGMYESEFRVFGCLSVLSVYERKDKRSGRFP